MFKRDILFHLERWKDDTHRKPLILRGARQVGKTTVVNEFGKQFDNYLYLNLEKREAASLFELNVSLKDLMPLFFAHCGKIRNEGTILLFIDEIQNSAKAVALLRYFYEELPDIYVIAAGSLLENLIDVRVSFPCKRFVDFLDLLALLVILSAVVQDPCTWSVAHHIATHSF